MSNKTLGTIEPDSDVINSQPKVLLIGYGWVGQQMGKYFTEAHYVESDGVFKDVRLEEEVDPETQYDLAIISVPTPMNPKNGRCDVSIVEKVIEKYKNIVGIFLIKSTVEIGTCERLEKEYQIPICMSPEYVGETLGHPMVEVDRTQFQIIGGNEIAREAVMRMWMRVLHADAQFLLVSASEAEIIKYCENYWIMQRVEYWNDVFDICQKFKASYSNVREGVTLDPRMNRTHSNIYTDNRGWGGKCLPKDMNALAYSMTMAGKPLYALQYFIRKNATRRQLYKNNNRLIPDNPVGGW